MLFRQSLSCWIPLPWLAYRLVSPMSPRPLSLQPRTHPGDSSQVDLRIRPMSAAELAEGARPIVHRVDRQVWPRDRHPRAPLHCPMSTGVQQGWV